MDSLLSWVEALPVAGEPLLKWPALLARAVPGLWWIGVETLTRNPFWRMLLFPAHYPGKDASRASG